MPNHKHLKRDPKAMYCIFDYSTHIRYHKNVKRDGKDYRVKHHEAPDWMLEAMAVLDMVPVSDTGYASIHTIGSKNGNYYTLYRQQVVV